MGDEQFAKDGFSVSSYIVNKPVMRELLSPIMRIESDDSGNKYYDANIITSYPKPCIPAGCCCKTSDVSTKMCSNLNNTFHRSDSRNSAQYNYCVMSPHGFTLQHYLYGLLNKQLYRSNIPLFMNAVDKNVTFFVGKNFSHFYGGDNELSEYVAGKQ